MEERHVDDHSGVETTGHEWDGIRELDNPLPRWWLWIWYACILFAIIYWVLMPAWPGISGYTHGLLGKSDRTAVEKDLADLQTLRGEQGRRLTGASLEDIERDPQLQSYAFAIGQSVFGDNCATCHGVGGTGGKGYPNLKHDVWLWGGSLEQIQATITHGARSGDPAGHISQMPAFGRDDLLKPGEIGDLTEFVVALSHRPADAAAAARAAPLFAAQCASCHGDRGEGNQAVGAPNLTDGDWLYGPDRQAISGQITNGRGGAMPAWGARLSPETIKALSVFIHANSAR
jgi:cytochrome c oxidase cbb3-type subunit 3